MIVSLLQQKKYLIWFCVGLFVLPVPTAAFFSNTERAPEQKFQASYLSLLSTSTISSAVVGGEVSWSVELSSSLANVMSDIVITPDPATPLCQSFILRVGSEEIPLDQVTEKHIMLQSIVDGTSTYALMMQPNPLNPPKQSGRCDMVLEKSAWQGDLPRLEGYFDQTNLTASFTYEHLVLSDAGVVLNEIYPVPLATSTLPLDREWVELYNPGIHPVDIEGWYLSEEDTTGATNLHRISASHTCAPGSKVGFARPYGGASTLIPAGGHLLIEFCAQNTLRNGGDTVALLSAGAEILDSYTYAQTSAGKAHARIPDGGIWVDPIPTPATVNTVHYDELLASGWEPERIALIAQIVIDFPVVPATPIVTESLSTELSAHIPPSPDASSTESSLVESVSSHVTRTAAITEEEVMTETATNTLTTLTDFTAVTTESVETAGIVEAVLVPRIDNAGEHINVGAAVPLSLPLAEPITVEGLPREDLEPVAFYDTVVSQWQPEPEI